MNISYIIIGVTAVISLYAFNSPDVMRKLIMNAYMAETRKEYFRFITSGFIHKDHMHLIFNMIALYFFGPIVESVFSGVFPGRGPIYFIVMYLLAIIVSEIPSYFKHRANPGYNSLGASGAVSAVVFAFVLFLPLEEICLYFILCFKGFILGAVYIIYSYYQGKKGGDNINHDAHLVGAVFGLLFCIVLYPDSVSMFIEQVKTYRPFQ